MLSTDLITFKRPHTAPAMLNATAANFDSVSLSIGSEGMAADSSKVNRGAAHESKETRPASPNSSAAW